jgi:crotonobetainyl-CoA:carnitine CoA-transferase CaiB-like acyl-CoA transferase
MVVEVPKPDGGTQQQIASPFKFSEGEAEYRWAGTAVGEHTDEILKQAGYTTKQIQSLRNLDVFG